MPHRPNYHISSDGSTCSWLQKDEILLQIEPCRNLKGDASRGKPVLQHTISETQAFENSRPRPQNEINKKELGGGGGETGAASDSKEQSIESNKGANELFYMILGNSPRTHNFLSRYH